MSNAEETIAKIQTSVRTLKSHPRTALSIIQRHLDDYEPMEPPPDASWVKFDRGRGVSDDEIIGALVGGRPNPAVDELVGKLVGPEPAPSWIDRVLHRNAVNEAQRSR